MSLSINSTGVAGFFESRIRQARIAHRHARLRRELARLPSYVARDSGAGPNQAVSSILLMTSIRHIRLPYEMNEPILVLRAG